MLTSEVFFDMTKVLNSVNYETLILKLHDVGAPNPVIQLFLATLMKDHNYSTNPFNILPEPLTINCRVPQGSILGPLSFIRYLAYTLKIFLQHHRNVASNPSKWKIL